MFYQKASKEIAEECMEKIPAAAEKIAKLKNGVSILVKGELKYDDWEKDNIIRPDGIDIVEKPIEAKKHIGFLPEQPPVYGDMTVNEYLNFVFDLKACGFEREAHLNEVVDVVKTFGGHFTKSPI